MNRVLATAGSEFRIALRNRWVSIAVVMMVLFSVVLSAAGSAPSGALGVDRLSVTVASLTSLAVYLVPLVALLMSFDAVARPQGQIHLDGLPDAPLFFSQVRDVVAYQRMPEQSHPITAIYVNDMGAAPSWENPGTGNWVALTDVVFVVGSDMMGGMGVAELVPFRDPAQAGAFVAGHGGTVMQLADIPDADVVPPVSDSGADDEDYAARQRKLDTKAGD